MMLMAGLEPRKGTILRAIVVEYVTGAEPVASELLASKYELGVRSATVRNEMAELTDLGFLEQPHTSAGRVPSDRGYRYYVDNLLPAHEVDASSKSSVKKVSEEGDVLGELLRDTAKALSRITHLLTAAAVVRASNLTVRSALVSALGPTQALLILVLSNGEVENRTIECPPGLTLADIGRVNHALQDALTGKPVRWMLRNRAPSSGSGLGDKLMSLIWTALRSITKEITRGSVTTEGEEFLFGQPEFKRDATVLTDLLDELKNSDVLFETLSPGEQAQTVTIGREHKHEQLHQLSIVRQTFYVGESEAGTIAIIGPRRMRYDSSIPLVDFAARALSDSLTRFAG